MGLIPFQEKMNTQIRRDVTVSFPGTGSCRNLGLNPVVPGSLHVYLGNMPLCRLQVGWRPLLVGWRPSLVETKKKEEERFLSHALDLPLGRLSQSRDLRQISQGPAIHWEVGLPRNSHPQQCPELMVIDSPSHKMEVAHHLFDILKTVVQGSSDPLRSSMRVMKTEAHQQFQGVPNERRIGVLIHSLGPLGD